MSVNNYGIDLGTAASFAYTAYRGMKRPRSGSYTANSRTVTEDGSGYRQLTYARSRAGRYLRKQLKINRILNSHTADIIERFQYVNNVSYGSGAYGLNYDDGEPNYNKLPCYFFDLTSIPNIVPSKSSPVQPCPLTRLYRFKNPELAPLGAYITALQGGKDNEDNNTTRWTLEKGVRDHMLAAVEKTFIEWVDMRFVLYGARKLPSWIEVMVVSFEDTEMVPGSYVDDPDYPSNIFESEAGRIKDPNSPEYNRWQTQYQGFIDHCTGSPIVTRDLKTERLRLKVKFSRKFKFNPTMTTENDVTGHQIAFNFKYHVNKVCNYVDDPQGHKDVIPEDEIDPNEWAQWTSSSFSPFTHKLGREFLIIKGFAPRARSEYHVSPPMDWDSDAAPSFDMQIRRKRTWIRS